MAEKLEGYVVDMHCVRTWPQAELQKRARKHPVECAREHLETGFCIVNGCAVPLDMQATPLILRALNETTKSIGLRLHLTRKSADNGMETVFVEEAIDRVPVSSSMIKSAGWQDKILELEFKSGVYQYIDVPKQIYEDLIHASSIGRYLNQNIKGKFTSRKI